MSKLNVVDREGLLVVDSRLIAEDLGIQHKNFLATLDKYLEEIEEDWGAVAFETREFKTSQGNVSTERVAFLTEPQATLLMTYSRNTEVVRRCKRQLVKAFTKAKLALSGAVELRVTELEQKLAVQSEAIAPQEGGASPQVVVGVEEKSEESPQATDCTSQSLVDGTQSQSAWLLAENQDSGVEVKDCLEGTCSAAPWLEEEKELTQSQIFEWLARADTGVCPPLWVIQYLLDSEYYVSMRASITKNEQAWNVSVVDYRATKKEENEIDLPVAMDCTTSTERRK